MRGVKTRALLLYVPHRVSSPIITSEPTLWTPAAGSSEYLIWAAVFYAARDVLEVEVVLLERLRTASTLVYYVVCYRVLRMTGNLSSPFSSMANHFFTLERMENSTAICGEGCTIHPFPAS